MRPPLHIYHLHEGPDDTSKHIVWASAGFFLVFLLFLTPEHAYKQLYVCFLLFFSSPQDMHTCVLGFVFLFCSVFTSPPGHAYVCFGVFFFFLFTLEYAYACSEGFCFLFIYFVIATFPTEQNAKSWWPQHSFTIGKY